MARSYGPFRRYLGLVQIASVTNNYCVASADQLKSYDTQLAEAVQAESTTAQ
jgi:hypothetical protein